MCINVLEKIDNLRVCRNWSMYELAENAGIPQSTLSNMFLRKTLPSINTLSKICKAFKISMSEFFTENDTDLKRIQSLQFLDKFTKLPASSRDALIQFLDTLE